VSYFHSIFYRASTLLEMFDVNVSPIDIEGKVMILLMFLSLSQVVIGMRWRFVLLITLVQQIHYFAL
jgi:hypothetical protein